MASSPVTSSGSAHSITSTALAPRESMTSTLAPARSGSSDQARYASDPPRILTRTSPGPADPRVATMRTPTQPIAASSRATPHALPDALTAIRPTPHYRCDSAFRPTAPLSRLAAFARREPVDAGNLVLIEGEAEDVEV